jgi:hypothetical protein
MKKNSHGYLIVTKPDMAYLFDGQNKLIDKFPVITGKDPSDRANLPDKNNNHPETTPPGEYHFSRNHIGDGTFAQYGGNVLNMVGDSASGVMFHLFPKSDAAAREAAIESPDPDDNERSDGCVSTDEIHVKEVEAAFETGMATVYVVSRTADYAQFLNK